MRRGLPTGSGRPAQEPPFAVETAREYARIKIDGLRLVGGDPDFTNAPCTLHRRGVKWRSTTYYWRR